MRLGPLTNRRITMIIAFGTVGAVGVFVFVQSFLAVAAGFIVMGVFTYLSGISP